MSSNYLWKFYLENDAEAFRRLLLEGTLPPAHKGNDINGSGGAGEDKRVWYDGNDARANGGTPSKSRSVLARSSKGHKELRQSFNRQALKEYDSKGRSLLHAASTEPHRIPYLKALLAHPQTDLLHPDLESGWSALHRALYHGNISAARLLVDAEAVKVASGGILGGVTLVKAKDNAGESPFELFYASIEGREEALQGPWMEDKEERDASSGEESDEDILPPWSILLPWSSIDLRSFSSHKEKHLRGGIGDEVYAFGSNKNLTLGFGDEDDRQYPERVILQRPKELLLKLSGKEEYDDLNAIEAFRPLGVQEVQLSKLHSAIITSDPHSNLYVCGFGHGGRLGLGDEQLTQFTYKNVSIGDKQYAVTKVALGLDHTVVILRNGEAWTWGGNKYGQLGYITGKATLGGGSNSGGMKSKKIGQWQFTLDESDHIQSTPRQVINNIKKEVIVGCAASRIHTVLHTHESVYVFGKNEGQLGIIDSNEANTLSSQPIPRKIAAGFLAEHSILTVAATEKTTVVMLETHDVWVFANYGYTRIVFPVQRFYSNPNAESRTSKQNRTRHNEPNYITKITTGGETICGLTRMGDVYTVNLGEMFRSGSSGHGIGKLVSPTPQRIWNRKKHYMAAKDVDVSQDGSIIICTQSGSVWRRVKRIRPNEPIGASSNNGGTGNIPSGTDTKLKDYKFSRVPGLTKIVSVRSNKFGAYAAIRKDCNIMRTRLHVRRRGLRGDGLMGDIEPLLSIRNALNGLTPFGPWTGKLSSWPRKPDMKKFRKCLDEVNSETCDMYVNATPSDIKIPVHRAVILGRSPILRRKLSELGTNETAEWAGGNLKLSINNENLQLDVNEDIMVVLIFVLYMYECRLPWADIGGSLAEDHARKRLSALANSLGLGWLKSGCRGLYMLNNGPTIGTTLGEALADPFYTAAGDMIVQLANDSELRLYSIIMRQRSPFFETLFKGGAEGRWIAPRIEQMRSAGETAIKVDMTHISLEIFQLVAQFIYTGKQDLLSEVQGMDSLEQYLQLVLDVLAVANELMIDELSMICQKVLGSFVNTRNASELLRAVAPYSQADFKNMCLQYMCFNMETMLENHLLDNLDDWIMEELDEAVQAMQRESSIFSRSGWQENRLLEKYPNMVQDMKREQLALIDSYAELIEARQMAEDAMYNSSKYKFALGGSPNQKKQKKKPTKEGLAPSGTPASQPAASSSTDAMFDMEDHMEPGAVVSTPRKDQVRDQGTLSGKPLAGMYYPAYISPASNVLLGSSWTEARNEQSSSLGADHFGSLSASKSGPSVSSLDIAAKPWNTSTRMTKLDMKEIMAQAVLSSSRQSNLSLGLSSHALKEEKVLAPVVASSKLSQKEKRRQQQQQYQQQQQGKGPLLATPEKPKSPAWQTPNQGPRIALKDILTDNNKSPAVGTNPTMGGLVASTGSPVQKRPPHSHKMPPSPTVQRTVPTPNVSAPPNPHTIIHQSTRPPSTPRPPVPPRPSFPPVSQSTKPPPLAPNQAAFPALPSSSSPPPAPGHSELALHLSLADIISQQEAEQDFLKGKTEKRKLEDIQAEQEFMDWWEKESERVRLEAEAAAGGGGGGSGRRGGKGGGRNGRGGKSGEMNGANAESGVEAGGRGGGGGGSGKRAAGNYEEGGRAGRGRGGKGRGKDAERSQQPATSPVQGIVSR